MFSTRILNVLIATTLALVWLSAVGVSLSERFIALYMAVVGTIAVAVTCARVR
jgi:hypothetical protein